jgi:hypothetical protein
MKLLCVGIGQQLTEACECFDEYGFFDCIAEVFDNNPREFVWRGNKLTAKATEQIAKTADKSFVIYISSTYYYEIYEQLNRIPQLTNTECYIHAYVSHMPIPCVLSQTVDSLVQIIPKKLHYCWFGGKEIPRQNRIWMETWKKFCPDYEIIKWDESNYDISKFEFTKEMYRNGKYSFVADCARLDILYHHGGIYVEPDMELIGSFDGFLHNVGFCSMTSYPIGVSIGAGFGVVAGHPFTAEQLAVYERFDFAGTNEKLEEHNISLRKTIFEKYGFKYTNRYQKINGISLYPSDVLTPENWFGLPLAYTENTIAIHHFDSSWYDPQQRAKGDTLRNKAKKFWETYKIEA